MKEPDQRLQGQRTLCVALSYGCPVQAPGEPRGPRPGRRAPPMTAPISSRGGRAPGEVCGHARPLGARECVYLQPEEWQRWEGNQLLHTGRLTLCPVHLETNETLIVAHNLRPSGRAERAHPTLRARPRHPCRARGGRHGTPGAWALGLSYASSPPATQRSPTASRVSYRRPRPWSGPGRAGCHRRAGPGACSPGSCRCCT